MNPSNARQAWRKTLNGLMLALTALILHYPYEALDFHRVGMGLLWLALIITVASGVGYFRAFFRQYPRSRQP